VTIESSKLALSRGAVDLRLGCPAGVTSCTGDAGIYYFFNRRR
jgi:hypothetical protein